jgi:hypothetical protein
VRDPIEDLQHFRTDGTPVNPLPASEVRRRGDRMRRRNTALATVGGVAAALVAVAVPLSVMSGAGDDRPDISPAPPAPSVSWLQEVPEDFPLHAELTGGTRDGKEMSVPEACGTPFWSMADTTDVAEASAVSDPESYTARTLAVYPDQVSAEQALDGIRAAAAACPEEPDSRDDTTLFYDVLDRDLGTEDSLVLVEAVRYDDGLVANTTVTLLGRTGNALLLDQSYSSSGGQQTVEQMVRTSQVRGALTWSAMCVFSADPCGATDGTDGPDEPAAQVVPDGFPLLSGWPTDSAGGEFGLAGPTRTGLDVIEPEACGAVAEVPEHTDLVRGAFNSPEDYRQRQLLTFATVEEADAYVDDVLAIFDDCFEVETEDGSTRLTQVITDMSGTADRAGGAVTRYERDGEPVPGMSTLLVVRVGSAVLLAENQSEGNGGLEPAAATQEAFTAIVAESRAVVDAMGDLRAG